MELKPIAGGFYDELSHAYYGPDGKWIPSATQILTLCGLSDYSMIKPEVLENKRRIGKEVHLHCAEFDKHGFLDPSWISDDAKPYVDAYLLFREQRRFVPDAAKVEVPMIAEVHGMKFGVTPDAPGTLDGYAALLERKCVEASQAVWAVQTALQEMALHKSGFCGRMQRFALQLKKSGKYKIDPHENHKRDASRAIAVLVVVYTRLDAGERVWEELS